LPGEGRHTGPAPEFEQAIIRAQFSPKLFKELVRFEVDMNSVPLGDKTNKDITVNWKFYDGFDPKAEFWTDSNGLQMQKRQIDHLDGHEFKARESRIPRNYYPIDSAISMQDRNGSNVMVTVMNDRAQGGSADLSDKATIEIMQQRRQFASDGREGFDEALNETDPVTSQGIQANAVYTLQIFDGQ